MRAFRPFFFISYNTENMAVTISFVSFCTWPERGWLESGI